LGIPGKRPPRDGMRDPCQFHRNSLKVVLNSSPTGAV
jgi:hypothetical protein